MIIGTFRDKGSSSAFRSLQRFATPSDAGSDDSEITEVKPARDENIVGWAYVGSHNFTPSAWGTLSGSAFNPTLNVCALLSLIFVGLADVLLLDHEL